MNITTITTNSAAALLESAIEVSKQDFQSTSFTLLELDIMPDIAVRQILINTSEGQNLLVSL